MSHLLCVRPQLRSLALCVCALASLLTACQPVEKPVTPAAPPGAFSGEQHLRGTVGSLAKLQGFEPILVSGYGLVVDLPGTGSPDAPAFIRQWMINEMKKQGLGSNRLGTQNMTPARVLASEDTAIVQIEGLIPPGATKGTRFDILIRALPETQTTSLEGGRLWSAELAVGGANRQLRFRHPLAKANGPVYMNPFETRETSASDAYSLTREAIIIAGGAVTTDRPLTLVLNQPSYQRSRLISDRINERFPAAPNDKLPTAVAKSDLVIELNIPSAYRNNPADLVNLIRFLFVQRAPDFAQAKAAQLAEVLVARPDAAPEITLSWQALGKTALAVVRRYYQHPKRHVQIAALTAGSRLGDGMTIQTLEKLAAHDDPRLRVEVANLLANLPSNLRASTILQQMLDDSNNNVRVAAYQALVSINDPVIQRRVVGGTNDPKFVLDLVPAEKPMVYVNQSSFPQLAIFNKDTAFKTPLMARVWDNRLMLRAQGDDEPLTVFYQGYGNVDGKQYEIYPALANLVFLLGHQTSVTNPTEGLDLTYSQVINAIYELRNRGYLNADMEVDISPLAKAIVRYKANQAPPERPELENPTPQVPPENATSSATPDDGGT